MPFKSEPCKGSSIHLERVKQSFTQLSKESPFLFAMACAERLWLPYQRASQGMSWEKQTVYRASLDLAWQSAAWLGQLSEEVESLCENAIPEATGPMAWAARSAAVSFYAVVCIIRRRQVNECASAAKANLDALDQFIYELTGLNISKANDLKVCDHELMKAEMTHQTQDLDILRQPLSHSLVMAIRQRSTGKSILGNYWLSGS